MTINGNYKKASLPILIEGCLAKDGLAWAEFIRRYDRIAGRALTTRLESHGLTPAETGLDDLKQAFFIKLWEGGSLESVKGALSIDYWVAMVAANFATDHYRDRKKDVLADSVSLFEIIVSENEKPRLDDFMGSSRLSPDNEAIGKETGRIIDTAMEGLNDRERIALRLFAFGGMSHADISRLIGTSIENVALVIHRAREKIKNYLQG